MDLTSDLAKGGDASSHFGGEGGNAQQRDMSPALILAAAVGAGIAHLGAVAMPFQIGAVMDRFHMSPGVAGEFGMLEMGALALSMILSAPVIARMPSAVLAMVGALCAALGHLCMFFFARSLMEICLLAVLSGTGYGAVFSATIAGVSNSANPDRIYALSSAGSVVIVVALMALFPVISVRFGALGPFLGIGMLILILSPVLIGFAGRTGRDKIAIAAPEQAASVVGRRGAIALYVVWTCFSLGSGVAWSFAERMGRAIPLEPSTIGAILSATTFVGVGGTLLAAAGAGRLSRLVALVLGLIGTGAGCLIFSVATGAVFFALGTLCFWVSSMFFYCVVLGTAAALDPSGRVGTRGGGCDRLGFACGAPLGGFVLGYLPYPSLGLIALAGCTLPVLLTYPTLQRALREAAVSKDRANRPKGHSVETDSFS